MNLSFGFLVLAFIALLLVVLPSGILVRRLWRLGGLHRGLAAAAIGCVGSLALACFIPGEEQQTFEESAFVFLVMWGALLYAVLAFSAFTLIGRAALRGSAEEKARDSRPERSVSNADA